MTSLQIAEITFQFHKGTIKTETSHRQIILLIQFQFHKGTIKTHRAEQQMRLH